MKQKRMYSIILVLSLLICTIFSSGSLSLAAGMEGDGTESSPYIIRTVSHLYSIPSDSAAHYKLANDLDFKNAKRSPLPNFKGFFDGNGYTIRNIVIQGTPDVNYIGLFISLNSATIKNLTIQNANVSNYNSYTGTLAGSAVNSSILNCASIGGNVLSSTHAGGLVGYAETLSFYRCYSTSPVTATAGDAGGLVGYASGVRFDECFANNDVSGASAIGGIVGYQYGDVTYANCYATNTLTSTDNADAGIASGYIYSGLPTFINCYFASEMTAGTKYGLSGTITDTYLDNDICQLSSPDIRHARTTDEMYTEINYNTWDFENVWTISEGSDYPKLLFMGEAGDLRLKLVLEKGEKINLEALYDVPDGTLVWESSNSSVASVDQSGYVKALEAGDTMITIGSTEDPFIDYIYILVVDKIEGQRITVRLKEDASVLLTADNNKNTASIQWNVIDPAIAAVTSKGKVTAISKGITVVTAVDLKTGKEIGNVYIKVK